DICVNGVCGCSFAAAQGECTSMPGTLDAPGCCPPTARSPGGCVDTSDDPNNCGGCGREGGTGGGCGDGRGRGGSTTGASTAQADACTDGGAGQPDRFICCADACVDASESELHCGRCGNACNANAVCNGLPAPSAACICASAQYSDCDGDLNTTNAAG